MMMMPKPKVFGSSLVAAALLCLPCVYPAYADVLHLKNGRTLEGVIVRDDADAIRLQVCSGGFIKVLKADVDTVERMSEGDNQSKRANWEKAAEQHHFDKAMEDAARIWMEESRPRTVKITTASGSLFVNATMNGRIEAKLLVDTGASLVMLSRSMAERLGFNLRGPADGVVIVGDGRRVPIKRIVLPKVRVQDVEAHDVEAGVILEETAGTCSLGHGEDGLLGMSFLRRYQFSIDYEQRKLTLQKPRR